MTKHIEISQTGTPAFPIFEVWIDTRVEKGFTQEHLAKTIGRFPTMDEAKAFKTQQEAILINPLMAIPTQQLLELNIALIKAEILKDIADGKIPVTAKSFEKLHDYTDAHAYGLLGNDVFFDHLIERFGGHDEEEAMPQEAHDFCTRVFDEIDKWLKKR